MRALFFLFFFLSNNYQGSLDELKTDAQRAESEGFYQRVAQLAKEKGVAVSVLSIAGTECRIENLGVVVDVTGGNVRV